MTKDAIHGLFQLLGWADHRADQIHLVDDDDAILPTPFRITETAVAALSAVGLAISDIWKLRTGRQQTISLSAHQATASLRSGRYMLLDGKPVPTGRDTITGIYPAKNDRWSYIHCNFPNHRDAALDVLGVPYEFESVKNAIKNWDALELEEALIAANGAGGMIRTLDEWSLHPQGKALDTLPLMEIIKIGDSEPEPLPKADRPLSEVRVLDLTRVLAGPTCARTLAEHGADVLKITASHLPHIGLQDYDTGHGKLSTFLDLRRKDDLDTLHKLVQNSDIFSQGYRPGTLDSRGLSPEELAELRPGIIYVSLSAFGHTGPWSSRRGFDTVVQTVNGIADRQGQMYPGEVAGPQFYPVSAIDYLSGYLMALGALVALERRAKEGGSWLIRISLAQTGRWLLNHGQLPNTELRRTTKEFRSEDIASWSQVTNTVIGQLQHLKPVLSLSETPPRWDRPPVPLGHHKPVWP